MNWFRNPIYFGLVAWSLAGCALPGAASPTPTLDADSIVAAAQATASMRLSQAAALATPTASATLTETPIPTAIVVSLPTSIPTMPPMSAVMNSNANVRGVPAKSKAHDLGGMLKGQQVNVIGRNADATWLYILYADSPTGTGWVTVKAITLSGEMGLLPVLIFPNGQEAEPIMLPPFIFKVTGTPLPPAPPPADWQKYGTLLQPANVRIGPSVGFLSMGFLEAGVKVTFRGRTAEHDWVQIDYPSGPDGHGWILSELAQANDGFGGLPFYDILGTPVTPKPENSAQPEATNDPNLPPSPSETPNPSETPGPPAPTTTGAEAEVTAQINVRSGPAQSYSAYGMLNPKEKVTILGQTINKLWYQIKYSGSPDGTGWVASQYLRVSGDMSSLPYFNDQGTVVP